MPTLRPRTVVGMTVSASPLALASPHPALQEPVKPAAARPLALTLTPLLRRHATALLVLLACGAALAWTQAAPPPSCAAEAS